MTASSGDSTTALRLSLAAALTTAPGAFSSAVLFTSESAAAAAAGAEEESFGERLKSRPVQTSSE